MKLVVQEIYLDSSTTEVFFIDTDKFDDSDEAHQAYKNAVEEAIKSASKSVKLYADCSLLENIEESLHDIEIEFPNTFDDFIKIYLKD